MRRLLLTNIDNQRLERTSGTKREERAREVDAVWTNQSMDESTAHEVLRCHLEAGGHVRRDRENATVAVEHDVRSRHRLGAIGAIQ